MIQVWPIFERHATDLADAARPHKPVDILPHLQATMAEVTIEIFLGEVRRNTIARNVDILSNAFFWFRNINAPSMHGVSLPLLRTLQSFWASQTPNRSWPGNFLEHGLFTDGVFQDISGYLMPVFFYFLTIYRAKTILIRMPLDLVHFAWSLWTDISQELSNKTNVSLSMQFLE